MSRPRRTGTVALRVAATVLAVGAALLASAVPASAFSRASYPTQSLGSRGTDVLALQYLLEARGHGVTKSGYYGRATRDAVSAFQASRGLTADGVTRPSTWRRLVLTVRYDSRGPAVRAVQRLLDAKRAAGLPLTGWFGPQTRDAVRTFQRHAGLTVDGAMGADDWRNLVWHYERVSSSGTCRYPTSTSGHRAHWGTAAAVRQVESAASAVRVDHGPVAVGDVSHEHGGEIAGHVTHEVGLDVDVRPMRRDHQQCAYGTTYRYASYDRAATRAFLRQVYARGHVELVYFNDPVLIGEGLTTWYSGHDNHLHVRYCEAWHPSADYTC